MTTTKLMTMMALCCSFSIIPPALSLSFASNLQSRPLGGNLGNIFCDDDDNYFCDYHAMIAVTTIRFLKMMMMVLMGMMDLPPAGVLRHSELHRLDQHNLRCKVNHQFDHPPPHHHPHHNHYLELITMFANNDDVHQRECAGLVLSLRRRWLRLGHPQPQ